VTVTLSVKSPFGSWWKVIAFGGGVRVTWRPPMKIDRARRRTLSGRVRATRRLETQRLADWSPTTWAAVGVFGFGLGFGGGVFVPLGGVVGDPAGEVVGVGTCGTGPVVTPVGSWMITVIGGVPPTVAAAWAAATVAAGCAAAAVAALMISAETPRTAPACRRREPRRLVCVAPGTASRSFCVSMSRLGNHGRAAYRLPRRGIITLTWPKRPGRAADVADAERGYWSRLRAAPGWSGRRPQGPARALPQATCSGRSAESGKGGDRLSS
jgi:hypothetical protein